MKNRIPFLVILVAAISLSVLSSCHIGCIKGSGNKVTENRKITRFSKIEVSGDFKINIKQDSSLALTVTADDNLMKYIRTQVNGNKLRIYTRKNFCNDSPIVINVGIGQLEEIQGSGAVEIAGEGRINVQNLNLDFSGVSKIDMDLSAADVKTKGRGVANITLKGQAASHEVEISGEGKMEAFDFVVGTYSVVTKGSANCQINVLKTLSVNTSGASEIQYKGSPTSIKEEKKGASTITKVN